MIALSRLRVSRFAFWTDIPVKPLHIEEDHKSPSSCHQKTDFSLIIIPYISAKNTYSCRFKKKHESLN